jgi:hypothetical protein
MGLGGDTTPAETAMSESLANIWSGTRYTNTTPSGQLGVEH